MVVRVMTLQACEDTEARLSSLNSQHEILTALFQKQAEDMEAAQAKRAEADKAVADRVAGGDCEFAALSLVVVVTVMVVVVVLGLLVMVAWHGCLGWLFWGSDDRTGVSSQLVVCMLTSRG